MKEHSENFNKEINIYIYIKTILEGVNSRLDVAEEWISVKDPIRIVKRKKKPKDEDSLREL